MLVHIYTLVNLADTGTSFILRKCLGAVLFWARQSSMEYPGLGQNVECSARWSVSKQWSGRFNGEMLHARLRRGRTRGGERKRRGSRQRNCKRRKNELGGRSSWKKETKQEQKPNDNMSSIPEVPSLLLEGSMYCSALIVGTNARLATSFATGAELDYHRWTKIAGGNLPYEQCNPFQPSSMLLEPALKS